MSRPTAGAPAPESPTAGAPAPESPTTVAPPAVAPSGLIPTETVLTPESATVPPGGTVQIRLLLQKPENISTLGFNLEYDPAVLEVISVSPGSLLKPPVYNDKAPGIIRFGLAASEAVSVEQGSVAVIKFRVSGTVARGARIELRLVEVAKPTDSSGNSLSIGLEPGFLTIESRQQGDGDGKDGVAILDALIALKIFVGLIEYDPVLHNLDMEPPMGG